MARPSLLFIACPFAGSRRADTLLSTSLHISVDINSFCLASLTLVFWTALYRAANTSSSLVGSVGGFNGNFFRTPRYRLCFVREALCRQPSTMQWSELCQGSWTETFPKRRRSVPRIKYVQKPHLPSLSENAPRPPVTAPTAPSREEVRRHVLQSLRCQNCHHFLLPLVTIRFREVDVHIFLPPATPLPWGAP